MACKAAAGDQPHLARGRPQAALVLHAVHNDAPQQLRPLHWQRLPVPVCHLHHDQAVDLVRSLSFAVGIKTDESPVLSNQSHRQGMAEMDNCRHPL